MSDRFTKLTLNIYGGENQLNSSCEIKPHSTPATLLWLGKNYELAEGICIPRNTLYSHYVHFCQTNSMSPLNSASFGKIIRQAFPSLTTRRLGTRGQSQYHYCGIAIKDSSPYYDTAFSKMIFTCSDGKKTLDKNNAKIFFSKNKGNVKIWPNFPNIKEIPMPPHVSEEKVSSFIIMYHTHCQRIFDTIIRGTLDDAYQFLEHFWQGVPSHLTDLLDTNTVVNMVGVCDSILYRTISSVFMPSVLKKCSDNLIQMIRNFADKLENWINSALTDVPQSLKTVKLKLGKRFCTTLKRQMILYQLTHTAEIVLNNCEMMNHINKDWKRINLEPITKQALLFTEGSNDHIETIQQINKYWKNFQELIGRQATIEDFTDTIETIVHRCIVEMSEKKQIPLRNVAKSFILLWHVIESLISRDMTIHSAASFGSFHLIQTMFDEYMHYLIEMLHSEDITKYLLKNITLDVLPNLDLSWTEYNDNNCYDVFNSTSNLRSLANVSGTC
ncbi:rfx4, putative [Pediculus humanus corporis]|uniref:DNA-binding protein RFX6 n=1 Tax=Pediculus humanus subsp. corporis TaxID=121224 RepID=E0VJ00_PEDHC|nr:rfx4, putative [Pediculus humanus corporis]EEB13356.1 rfx4, putative [Pediculus humanus corporis]